MPLFLDNFITATLDWRMLERLQTVASVPVLPVDNGVSKFFSGDFFVLLADLLVLLFKA
jgi:hypothetical protein